LDDETKLTRTGAQAEIAGRPRVLKGTRAMTTRIRNTIAAAAAVLTLGACASGNSMENGSIATGAVLEVENNNWADMNIYAVRGSMRQRLGTVASFDKRRFVVRSELLLNPDGLLLEADPIGSRDVLRSPPIVVSPGQTVHWDIENHLSLSSAYIRNR
jgi:hypothetical protein